MGVVKCRHFVNEGAHICSGGAYSGLERCNNSLLLAIFDNYKWNQTFPEVKKSLAVLPHYFVILTSVKFVSLKDSLGLGNKNVCIIKTNCNFLRFSNVPCEVNFSFAFISMQISRKNLDPFSITIRDVSFKRLTKKKFLFRTCWVNWF